MHLLSLSFSYAETTLGTLNTIKNGFGMLDECQQTTNTKICQTQGPIDSLSDVLNFTSTNQCIAKKSEFNKNGINIPDCPKEGESIQGLPNTHPSVGTFSLYTGNNDNFIHDLAKNYLSSGMVGKFNLIIPKGLSPALRENEDLLKVLNSPRVNIVEVETTPLVERWMQDSFQFTSINGKPAIYQLEHGREREKSTRFEDRIACILARECDIPYYIPPDMVDPLNSDHSDLNHGGNLEVLPGGTFYSGIVKTEGYPYHKPSNETTPYRTKSQQIQKDSFKASGNKIIEIDISFLEIGHVDEIFNIVKTNKAAPCDYAVLMASPSKAFELMDESAQNKNNPTAPTSMLFDFIFPNAYAGLFITPQFSKKLPIDNRCVNKSEKAIWRKGMDAVITEEEVENIYESLCIDGLPVEHYIYTNSYKALKRQNLEQENPPSIAKIMKNNKKTISEELKRSTGCQNPKFVEIPVFFRNGGSELPDLVNGVIETPPGEASNVLLPRSYFKPFDSYVENELSKLGVDTSFIHDMGYHLGSGEVHCGTNTARICNQ